MSVFSKANKYRKPSRSIDEKVKLLNQDLKKTGVVTEDAPANSTKHVYNTFIYHPSTEVEFTDVPDPGGVRSDGWTQPSNGYDASDSSTWDNAYPNTDWIYNPNEVRGVTGRPVVVSPDTPPEGETIGRFGPGGALIRASIGYGIGLGYLKSDNTYQGILYNSYWGTLYAPTESARYGSEAPYRGYTDEEYAFMQDAHSKMLNTTFGKEVKFWAEWSYFWYGSWDSYSGTKKDTGSGKYVLKTGWISGDPNTYQSQDNAPAYNEVLTRDSISDGSVYPGNVGKFMSFLRGALDVGEKAFEYLKDKVSDPFQQGVEQLMNELESKELELPQSVKDFVDDVKENGLVQSAMDNIFAPFFEGEDKAAKAASLKNPFDMGVLTPGGQTGQARESEISPYNPDKHIWAGGKNLWNFLTNKLPDTLDNNYLNSLDSNYVNNMIQQGWLNEDGTFRAGENIIGNGGVPVQKGDWDIGKGGDGTIEIPFDMDFKDNAQDFADRAKDGDPANPFSKALHDFLGPYSSDASTSTGIPAIGGLLDLLLGGIFGEIIDTAKWHGGGQYKPGVLSLPIERIRQENMALYSALVEAGIIGGEVDKMVPGSKVQMDMPSWFWYGGFGAPQWGTHEGKPVIWGTNFSGGRGYITPGGGGPAGSPGSGYGTRGYNPRTGSGGTSWTWHSYEPEAKPAPEEKPETKPEPKKDEKDNEWMPKDDPKISATYGKGSKKSDWFADFEKQVKDFNDRIDPAQDPFSRKGTGMGDRWKGSQLPDKGLGSVASVYNRQADATTFSAIQSKISRSSGTSSRSTGTKKKKKNNKFGLSYDPAPNRYSGSIRASYNPNTGALLSEGWASPKHTDVDKDEKKRWFNPKDIQPEYPKDPPPKMVNGYHPKMLPKLDTAIPYIKVERKDLERSHKLKKYEAQEYVDLVNRLNNYIKRNPDQLAYARERYPKHDPRLAELNYKLDMQNAASDEYMSKHFPENEKLFNRLVKATQRSITLTDPKTYKDKKGKMTSYKKLLRVDYVLNEYDPKDSELKIKKIKSDKKSIGRFFRKPKKKTKGDILKDKMAVLDKEMKKTMPDW